MNWLRHLRSCLIPLVVTLLYHGCAFADSDWNQFKASFISDGRVVDADQNGISHTEGQGMAMLLAVQNDDPKTFRQLLDWTQGHLQKRDDKLFAWSWAPGIGITDTNNASDGDLFIAWALSKAYTKWQEPRYLFEAIRISQAIRTVLLRKTNKGTVILPGAVGFEKPDGLKLNLSYWVFPAINELASLDPSPEWAELKSTGLSLIQEARFGKWRLPPDWLLLNGNTVLPSDDDRFGYDAVRIPLYLIWGKQANSENINPFQAFWNSFQGEPILPPWVNLTDGSVATYNASMGFHNVAQLTTSYPQVNLVAAPNLDPNQGYYSAMLTLFTKYALEDLQK